MLQEELKEGIKYNKMKVLLSTLPFLLIGSLVVTDTSIVIKGISGVLSVIMIRYLIRRLFFDYAVIFTDEVIMTNTSIFGHLTIPWNAITKTSVVESRFKFITQYYVIINVDEMSKISDQMNEIQSKLFMMFSPQATSISLYFLDVDEKTLKLRIDKEIDKWRRFHVTGKNFT